MSPILSSSQGSGAGGALLGQNTNPPDVVIPRSSAEITLRRRYLLPSRLLSRKLCAAADAPTITFQSGSPVMVGTDIDIVATGAALFPGGPTPTHPDGGYPNTITYRPRGITKDQLGSDSVYASGYTVLYDGDKLQFSYINRGGTSYRVTVDDAIVGSLIPVTKATTGLSEYVSLDFTGSGGAKPRRIRFELAGGDFYAVTIPTVSVAQPGYTLTTPTRRGPRMAWIGDSLITASGISSSPILQIPKVVGELLGADDVWGVGRGGSGYIVNNAPSGSNTARAQVLNLAGLLPPTQLDVLICAAGHNDAGTDAQVAAEAVLVAQAAKTAWPQAVIIFTGPLGRGWSASREAAIFSAVAPYVTGVISQMGAGGGWVAGTGMTSAKTGDGNADIYIGSDGVHWNDAGVVYMAERMAQAITSLLPS